MASYIIRLDDAAEKRDISKWNQIEQMLDAYAVKPLAGVIPCCMDPEMEHYEKDACFWERVRSWEEKGWTIAMHGYRHVYDSTDGGINPVQNKSEFAGHPLEVQKKKIRQGIAVFRQHGIEPSVFFAPSHTFDHNTLEALKQESAIRIISDTAANSIYKYRDFWFVPQQSGRARRLPFQISTFCYHPNNMQEQDFVKLEKFIQTNRNSFLGFEELDFTCSTGKTIFDYVAGQGYFLFRKFRESGRKAAMVKLINKVKEAGFCNTVTGSVKRVYYELLCRKYRFDRWHISPYELRKYIQAAAGCINKGGGIPHRVIDIGCGLGELLRHVRAEDRIGYDAEVQVIRAAKRLDRTKKITFRQGRFNKTFSLGSIQADYLVTLNFTHGKPETYWKEIYHKQLSENDIRCVIVDVFPQKDGQYHLNWNHILPAGYQRMERLGPFPGKKYLEVYEKKQ